MLPTSMSIFFKKALKPLYYLIGLVTISLIALYITLSSGLPTVEEIQDMRMQIPMRVYTQDKKLIAVYGEKKRIPVTFEEIPENLKNAFIAAEDNRFYSHSGVDYIALLRALKSYISTGKFSQGGSTITMQVARNFYLTREKKISRKLTEIHRSINRLLPDMTQGVQEDGSGGAPGRRPIGRAGLPATMVQGGTSRVTTAPMPTTAWSPRVTPSTMPAWAPIQTSQPMRIPRELTGCSRTRRSASMP